MYVFFLENFLKLIGVEIKIDANQLFQSIIGFGGAFTDAVGLNLNKLSNNTRLNLLKSYYSKEGKFVYFLINYLLIV